MTLPPDIRLELQVMKRVLKALDTLPDDTARERVLRYFVSRQTGRPMAAPGQL